MTTNDDPARPGNAQPDGAVVPGARLPVHRAVGDALVQRAEAAVAATDRVSLAADRFGRESGAALEQARSAAGSAVSSAGAGLRIAFHDVETMTGAVTVLGRDIAALAASTAAIAVDGDLLASMPLSPVTGIAAEAALEVAAAGLSASALQTSALAVTTGAVVSSLAAADAWLAAAAGSLRAGGDATASFAGAGAGVLGSVAGATAGFAAAQVQADVTLATASAATMGDLASAAAIGPALVAGGLAAVAGGFGSETLRSLSAAFADANRAFGGDRGPFDPFDIANQLGYGAALAAGFDHHFSLDAALTGTVDGVQAILGATGPFYDDVLAGLVTTGFAFGLFRDGDVKVRPADNVDPMVLEDSASSTWKALGGAGSPEFDSIDGRIVPVDWASMMAGLGQLDDLGGGDRAIVRVFTIFDAGGDVVGHRVQIPSTARWNPVAKVGSTPGDLTSDLYAMWQGSDASLASGVYEAMRQAGVRTGDGAPPVELDGFSLGGITAAAIASDPRGFNVTAIHTAGSPIGGMDIAEGTRVYALEAEQDIVAALDGRSNSARPTWTTIVGPGIPRRDETLPPAMLPGTVHSAQRYAVMGASSAELQGVGALDVPPGGTVTVSDFEARREAAHG